MSDSDPIKTTVLIIGAGIGGIGYAVHLQNTTDTIILEGRETHGGTWDLFRYPGIRSDSDMFTFAYSFHPWGHSKYFSPGQSTCEYLEEVIDKYKLQINYGHRVLSANFSTKEKRWTVKVDAEGKQKHYQAQFIIGATGYFDYAKGHIVDFPGQDQFQGKLIHPQHWPRDFDYRNKSAVVIGSGATAVSIVPNMVKEGAKHVTMLQRSPGYTLSLHDNDLSYSFLKLILPVQWAFAFVRWKNELTQRFFYWACITFPRLLKWLLLRLTAWQLPSTDLKDLTPQYYPWEERLCFIPDNDLYKRIREGSVEICTDQIAHLDKNGIVLKSGRRLDTDIIVTATGISVKFFGDISYTVEGTPIDPGKAMLYRGALVSNMPNYLHMLGYTNSSWTLKVDIAATYFEKLLAHMRRHNHQMFVAVPHGVEIQDRTVFPLESNYIKRDKHRMFKQGNKQPWINVHSSGHDKRSLLAEGSRFEDEYLEFS